MSTSIAKLFLLYSVVSWVAGVGAIPAPSSVTLYTALPTVENVTPISAISGATEEVDVSILGVSSGAAGAETTYSIGLYQSLPAVAATAGGSLVTVVPTTISGAALTENFTLVESSGGFWASFSAFASGTVTSDGSYETCTFDANGASSASCKLIEYVPTGSSGLATATVTLEASMVPLAVVNATATATSPSNAAMSIFQVSIWRTCLYAAISFVLGFVA